MQTLPLGAWKSDRVKFPIGLSLADNTCLQSHTCSSTTPCGARSQNRTSWSKAKLLLQCPHKNTVYIPTRRAGVEGDPGLWSTWRPSYSRLKFLTSVQISSPTNRGACLAVPGSGSTKERLLKTCETGAAQDNKNAPRLAPSSPPMPTILVVNQTRKARPVAAVSDSASAGRA